MSEIKRDKDSGEGYVNEYLQEKDSFGKEGKGTEKGKGRESRVILHFQ